MVLVFLCGCGKSSTAPKQQATGAFGWKLGDRLPDGTETMIYKPTNAPSFKFIMLETNDERVIYSIMALGLEDDFYESKRAFEKALTDKYGLISREKDVDSEKLIFGDDHYQAELKIDTKKHSIDVRYVDQQLRQDYFSKSGAKTDAKVKAEASKL